MVQSPLNLHIKLVENVTILQYKKYSKNNKQDILHAVIFFYS